MTPLRVPVTVAFCATLTVAVVAEKLALLWLAATVTLAGPVSDTLLLLTETVVALVAALFKLRVQVLDALLLSALGEQLNEDSCAGATAVSVKF